MVPQVHLGEFGCDPKGAGPADTPTLMPALGYGIGTAWFRAEGDVSKAEALKSCIKQALDLGFRHLDDAEMYENCRITGMAVREWLLEGDPPAERPTRRKRSDLFITQKVDNFDAQPIRDTCDMLLEMMGLDYFDLFLLHSPFNRKTNQPYEKPLKDAWREMQELVVSGKVRAVGVSNFRIQDLEQVLASCKACEHSASHIRPICNQVEGNPFLQQAGLREFCSKEKITLTVYGPQLPVTKSWERAPDPGSSLDGGADSVVQRLLPTGRYFTSADPIGSPHPCASGSAVQACVESAARRLGKTSGQVLLRWAYQSGRVPITTTSSAARMQEYLDVFGFELSDEEMRSITSAGRAAVQERAFWRQVPGFYGEDPRLEAEFGC